MFPKTTFPRFPKEPPQPVAKPEEEPGGGEPERHGHRGESSSCLAEGLLPAVLQVGLCLYLHSSVLFYIFNHREADISIKACFFWFFYSFCFVLQAAHQGFEPPGDFQERSSGEAVGSLQRAHQTASPQEPAGQPGAQPQSLPGLH